MITFSSSVFFLDFEHIRDSKQSIIQITYDIILKKNYRQFYYPRIAAVGKKIYSKRKYYFQRPSSHPPLPSSFHSRTISTYVPHQYGRKFENSRQVGFPTCYVKLHTTILGKEMYRHISPNHTSSTLFPFSLIIV